MVSVSRHLQGSLQWQAKSVRQQLNLQVSFSSWRTCTR